MSSTMYATQAKRTYDTDKHRERFSGPGGLWTKNLAMSIFGATIGGSFLYGYYLSVFLGPAQMITKHSKISCGKVLGIDFYKSDRTIKIEWTSILFFIIAGGMLGTICCGKLIDRFGRKPIIMINNVFTFIGVLFLSSIYFAPDFVLLSLGSYIIGVSCGISNCVVPVYLHEIAPAARRGSISCWHYVMFSAGILVAQILGMKQIFDTETLWPLIFAFGFAPIALQVYLFSKCPESPKYSLIIKNYVEKAERDICKLRCVDDALPEIYELRGEALMVAASERVTRCGLFHGDMLWPMLSAIVLTLIKPLSGSIILLFAEKMRDSLNFSSVMASQMVALDLGHLLATIAPVTLVDTKRCGRRVLLLVGLSGMIFCMICLSICIFVLHLFIKDTPEYRKLQMSGVCFIHFSVIFCAIGPGPIPTFIVTELFDTGARGTAQSMTEIFNWIGNLLSFVCFHLMLREKNPMVPKCLMVPFIACSFLFFVFVYFFIPETNGQLVNEILADFTHRREKFCCCCRKPEEKTETLIPAPARTRSEASREIV